MIRLALASLTLSLFTGHAVHAAAADGQPVVAELFTSEGCSSCPPADRLLNALDRSHDFKGIDLIVIGQHVDYWDYLGWKDPYGDQAYSGLQRAYADTRGDGRVYTPQIVVNGRSVGVANQPVVVRSLIQNAASQQIAPLAIEVEAQGPGFVDVAVPLPSALAQPKPTSLRLIVAETGLSTQVRFGENAGRRLEHAPTARSVVELFVPPNTAGRQTSRLRVPADVDIDNARIVAVWQQMAGPVAAAGQRAMPLGG